MTGRFRPGVWLLRAFVILYQWTLRPFIGAHCRFEPSCSHYALQALDQHGAMRGSALAAGRILRCNPWNSGGLDPVPPAAARCTCGTPFSPGNLAS